MSSGQKRVLINSRERAVSDDINNLQAYVAQQHNDAFMYMHGMYRQMPGMGYPGALKAWSATTATGASVGDQPHFIFGGCMVRPQAGGSLLVDPGMVAYNTKGLATAADSNLMIARTNGVTDTSILVCALNSTGSTRIDIIEMQPQDVLIASSSRDIFDPITGLFTPVVVEKTREARCSYRIATSGGGLGLRAPQQAWVPLAIAFVKPGVSSYAQCDIYDVRPLVNEQVPHLYTQSAYGAVYLDGVSTLGFAATRAKYLSKLLQATSFDWQQGYYEAVWNGFLAGGQIRKNSITNVFGAGGSSGGDFDSFALNDADNKMTNTGTPFGSSTTLPVCALFPGGYPRWVRYSQNPIAADPNKGFFSENQRLPMGPRGILMVCAANTVKTNGLVDPTALAWPSWTGLNIGPPSGQGYGFLAFYVRYINGSGANEIRPSTGSLGEGFTFQNWINHVMLGGIGVTGTVSYPSTDYTRVTFDVTPGVGSIPPSATHIIVSVSIQLSIAVGAQVIGSVRSYTTNLTQGMEVPLSVPSIKITGIDSYTFTATVRVPVWGNGGFDEYQPNTNSLLHFLFNHSLGAVTGASMMQLTITGYDVS